MCVCFGFLHGFFSHFTRSKPKNYSTTLQWIFLKWRGERRQADVPCASAMYSLHFRAISNCALRVLHALHLGNFLCMFYCFFLLLFLLSVRSLVRFSCIHSLVFTIIMWTFLPYTLTVQWSEFVKEREKESKRACFWCWWSCYYRCCCCCCFIFPFSHFEIVVAVVHFVR